MSCRGFQELWEEYREGSLGQERMEALRAHLSVCPGCQQRLRDEDALDRCLGAWELPTAPPDLDETVVERASEEGVPRRDGVGVRLPLPLAVALLLLLFASITLNVHSYLAPESGETLQRAEHAVIVLPPLAVDESPELADGRGVEDSSQPSILVAGSPLPVKSHAPDFY